jgi:uncharacterized protein
VRKLVGPLLAVIVVAGLISLLEPRLVFFPSSGETRTPAEVGLPWRGFDISTSDGETIRAWYLEHPAPTAEIVYLHGNGGNLSLWLPVLAAIHAQGWNVFAIDYRGYGRSTGSPSENGVYEDVRAALAQHARVRRGRPVVYWGRSLGGPIAAFATTVAAPDGVILESTFPDKASVIRGNPVMRALNVFGRYKFPTIRFLAEGRRPVLVLHGDRDSIIGFDLGQELFEELGQPKQFATIPGGDHNDFFEATDPAYWKPIRAWIAGLPR